MKPKKTAYELSQSQVATPSPAVALSWSLTQERRKRIGKVLDLGAGDCRFAQGGNFDRYLGIEIDPSKTVNLTLPENAAFVNMCAFKHDEEEYDACVGNPPYVRHHDIESPWKEETTSRLGERLGASFNRQGNLYLYFLTLSLFKTRSDGLVNLIIPYEWVSRPSAKNIRNYINDKGWKVDVYRFQMPIFDNVLTTASISIIDKKHRGGGWTFFDVLPDYTVTERVGITNSDDGLLSYEDRGDVWALRGLSPGSQQVFTLTDGERAHHGLTEDDVMPCVTTLRGVPRDLKELTPRAFHKRFVEGGEKCWLVKSYGGDFSRRLARYLENVPVDARSNYTCQNQEPWHNYKPHPVPKMLVSSGFTQFGPKVLLNSANVCAVGSVIGIHAEDEFPLRKLQGYLLGINFEQQLVAHAKRLKKIEIKQLNGVLNEFTQARCQ